MARLRVLLLLGIATACGGGDGGGVVPPPLTAAFLPSATPGAADLVRLRAAASAGDKVTLEVASGGPTTSTDLYGFAFDIVSSDATVAAFVDGTASFGDALTLSGGQTGRVEVGRTGNRLVVGVSKLGGGSGNPVPAGGRVILRLTFRVLEAGTTTLRFSGAVSPQNPGGGPAALDSNGQVVGTVRFDAATAAISGL